MCRVSQSVRVSVFNNNNNNISDSKQGIRLEYFEAVSMFIQCGAIDILCTQEHLVNFFELHEQIERILFKISFYNAVLLV